MCVQTLFTYVQTLRKHLNFLSLKYKSLNTNHSHNIDIFEYMFALFLLGTCVCV